MFHHKKLAIFYTCYLFKKQSSTILAPGTCFMGRFFHGWGTGDGLGMIPVHYMYFALYFYYYYISSTSDHQALDPRGQGPLFKKIHWVSTWRRSRSFTMGVPGVKIFKAEGTVSAKALRLPKYVWGTAKKIGSSLWSERSWVMGDEFKEKMAR